MVSCSHRGRSTATQAQLKCACQQPCARPPANHPPHLISSHLISSHLISSHLISSHLISSYLTSCPYSFRNVSGVWSTPHSMASMYGDVVPGFESTPPDSKGRAVECTDYDAGVDCERLLLKSAPSSPALMEGHHLASSTTYPLPPGTLVQTFIASPVPGLHPPSHHPPRSPPSCFSRSHSISVPLPPTSSNSLCQPRPRFWRMGKPAAAKPSRWAAHRMCT